MPSYPQIPRKCITDLNDALLFNKKTIFKYKEHEFLYDYRKEKYLLVSFHGAVKVGTPLPVFRFYDKKFKNFDMLCLFDKLIQEYKSKKLLLGWYLGPTHIDIYTEIIKALAEKYEKILFYASSGGGSAAIYFASLFGQYCQVSNSQLYLPKYGHYQYLVALGLDYNRDLEKVLLEHKAKKIVIFQNKADEMHYNEHFLPFVKFLEENIEPERYKTITFNKSAAKPHSVLVPSNTVDYHINNYFKIIV